MANKVTRADQDPTNQASNRAKANRDNNRRLNNSAREALAMWRGVEARKTVRKKVVNQEEEDDKLEFFVYDLSPEEIQAMEVQISNSLDENLETFTAVPLPDWYYEQYIEQAYRSGTIQENALIAVLLSVVAGSILLETSAIFLSPTYLENLRATVFRNYPLFKSLSETTSKQVFQVIQDGINSGLSKSATRRKILERYEVSKSSAKRIVDTEVNRAYNNARIDLVKTYRDNGAPLAVQHISALLPTTRDEHAARHGLAYTPEQQMRWWDSGTNRINCHCRANSIVINRDGTVRDKTAQDKVIKRGKDIFKQIKLKKKKI